MLTTYPEIRDRIYQLARKRDLHVDWVASTPDNRTLFLYDSRWVLVARARVPLRQAGRLRLTRLADDLAEVFGEGWME